MPGTVPAHIWELAHSDIDLSAPTHVRIAQAKAWLRVYDDETAASTARLYDLSPDTLRSSVTREIPSNSHQIGGLNRVSFSAVVR